MELVCVFAASSKAVGSAYTGLARELGTLLAKSGRGLVFGGGDSGLMGACARGVKECGGRVVGVIPERLNRPGVAYPHCDELIETPTMHQRKAAMEGMCSAFVALPGGFGTLEELLEVIVLKQLGYHNLPIILVNHEGFFDGLLAQLDRCVEENFTHEIWRSLYHAAENLQGAMAYLEGYVPADMPDKTEEIVR